MVPAVGTVTLVLITKVAVAVPQAVVTVYEMVSNPEVIAVTRPTVLTVAFVLLLLHTPSEMASVSVTGVAAHTLPGPVIVPAVTVPPMVTFKVAKVVPQLLITL